MPKPALVQVVLSLMLGLSLGGCPSPNAALSARSLSPAPVASDAAPSASPAPATASAEAALTELLPRLEGDWELEDTGKGYWIGYTKDMRAIAERGEAAVEPLVTLIKQSKSDRARYGALLTLHYIGIGGKVVGRYMEAFTCKPARDALLVLLSEESLQVEILTLLVRDPWPTDVPRLFGFLEAGTANDWAFVKALQRYQLAEAPVHQPLSPELAKVGSPEGPEGASKSTDGLRFTTRFSVNSTTGGFKSGRLAAIRHMPANLVVVEDALVESQLWEFDGSGSCDSSLSTALNVLTECDYCCLGNKLDYYVEDGRVHLCGMATAKARWLTWYRAHEHPLKMDQPFSVLLACFHGGIERVSALLDANPNSVNVRAADQDTPLHVAADSDLVDIVNLLLKRGADPKLVNNDGKTPLHKAAAKGHASIVETLLDAGSTVEARDKTDMTAVGLAAREGHATTVDLLVRRGASVDVFTAAASGFKSRAAAVVKTNGAAANEKDATGLTPLHYAARHGHLEVVDLLLENGANVDGGAGHGKDTPLHEAAAKGQVEVIQCLVRAGANVHAVGGLWGVHTPLQEAVREGHVEAVKLLLEAGARVNDNYEKEGRPALQWACACERVELVKLLLEHGADANQADKDGKKALWWVADARHNAEIERLLREHGAH